MFKTFVLINCEPGKEPEVLEQLHKIENVVDSQGTYGVYDIVARIESDSQSQLAHIISDQIRKISNINSTLTLLSTEEHKSRLADLIPDIIPEQKKPLEEPPSENNEENFDKDGYDDSTNQ
ncbi:MAG: Lrp/AsnC family transcriptional regulator [Thaumarchaeota archaeon]|nr:Lrp/AsnC family transcriptional regulator [Nitrososphaerota archaeon]